MTKAAVIRKSFTLTERDIEIIKLAIERCGYVSDSEAIRAVIRYFFEHAPCLKSTSTPP
jgi:Arc/MetJ-type ribon-helix-helix transcriptional regulator